MKITAKVLKHGWLPLLALIVIAWCRFGLESSPRAGSAPEAGFNALVHWREDGRDWLVVADGAAAEVVVYAATDGRPLHRLSVPGGLQDRAPLVQRDGHLFVVRRNGALAELGLPPLEIAAAGRR